MQQPGISRSLVIPFDVCCSGCGIYDLDADGICDEDDNCTNQSATNYADPANEDCIISGCTDTNYTEYNASATTDDGSCSTLISEGCTNPNADNYDAAANTDDGSCIIYGCMDQNYIEYNPAANTFNDGCNTLVVEGCTDPAYTEYDASANTNDGSFTTPVVEGCTDSDFQEYDASANTDDGSCATPVSGCTVPAGDLTAYEVAYPVTTTDFGGTAVSGYVVDLYVDLPTDNDVLLNVYNMSLTPSNPV